MALPYLLVALEADPETAEHWLVYADALMRAGQRDQAREVLALGRSHGLAGQAFGALLAFLDHFGENVDFLTLNDFNDPKV